MILTRANDPWFDFTLSQPPPSPYHQCDKLPTGLVFNPGEVVPTPIHTGEDLKEYLFGGAWEERQEEVEIDLDAL